MSKIEPDWDPAKFSDVESRMDQMAEVRQKCPVAYTDARGGQWTVSRYKDLVAVAADPQTFSNASEPRFGGRLAPLELDPPEHGFFRKALQGFWLPSRMRALEPKIREAARSLLDPLLERGSADFAREFTYPLPVMALCAQLNIAFDHWDEVKTWAEQTLAYETGTPEERELAQAAHFKLLELARDIVRDRQASPRDSEVDITTALLKMEIDGQPVEGERVAGVVRLLISAGHNSTTNALGNTFHYLARNPDAQEFLRRSPDKIPLAIEELLRWETPVQEMPRWAMKDIELGERHIHAGDKVGLLWASGNRDEDVFPDADACVLERRPNRHLAFGYGIHTCIGAPMARMELRLAVEELLSRTRGFSVAGEVIRPQYHHMGVKTLPLTFEV